MSRTLGIAHVAGTAETPWDHPRMVAATSKALACEAPLTGWPA